MKAFIIYLPEKEHSDMHSQEMLKTLKSYDIDAERFEGIPGDKAVKMNEKDGRVLYPYSIKSTKLSDDDVKELIRPEVYKEFTNKYFYNIVEKQLIGDDRGKLSMPGVKGCFYSHYALWNKCIELDEPIMIFEDDVIFYRKWIPVDWDDILVLSLGKSAPFTEPWKTYLENPTGNPQPISWRNFSMPGASGYAIKPRAARGLVKFYKPYFYPADNAINQFLCKIQVHNYLMGRDKLKEEGNISMTRAKDWGDQ